MIVNAAAALLERNRDRPDRIALIDDRGPCSHGELAERVRRFAGVLRDRDVAPATRMMLCAEDSVDFVVACLGAIWAGVVPVMVNPQLPTEDYRYLLDDSGAGLLLVSRAARPRFEGLDVPKMMFVDEIPAATPVELPAMSGADGVCLWQYSSGTTGRPKGTIHSHGAMIAAPALFAEEVLALSDADVTFSVSKMFFGYGFGNSVLFALWHGATAILMAERPTATAALARMAAHRPTILYSVPSFYAALLGQQEIPRAATERLRLCVSAGEALPAELCRRWQAQVGVPIVDGMGSTEMLHIFLANRPGEIEPGTTGRAVKGYTLELRDESGAPTPAGEIGELFVRGPTCAIGYWNKPDKSAAVFANGWVRTGDRFYRDPAGRFVYCGRGDDMLKVNGIYVSPLEIEAALATHAMVGEVAVVGAPDRDGLIKPVAFVVAAPGAPRDAAAEEMLKAHTRTELALYKYPRRIRFVDALPKTATGKIERFKLRAWALDGQAP
ncbi:MAG: benzoate-CoA ligase family protein [Pseudomonadota bacterium]|uniref:benzoate-CoA ligase family protein n=1 Tax=Sphingomonas sp. ERG5 TaxID=1381597 RepID=UPI00054B31CF|nr:benzoate-CoA ligase family protein [Sphingomonas sp. ERG5]